MKNNKKMIVFILILVLILVISVIVILKIKDNTLLVDDIETYSKISQIPSEIKIYDIEEGYLSVPYNVNADKNTFDFEKCLKDNNGYYKYEDENYKSKLGIDVSSYQGDIDWKKVKEDGIEFAILRLGYRGYGSSGKIMLDSKFEKNYKNATKQGIKIGVYFFSQSINLDEINEEALFVLKNLEGKTIDYPVVFDLEKIKNDKARTDNLTLEEITKMTLEFCNIMRENNYTPSIYGNAKTFTTRMKLELFNDHNKWYADYQENPIYPYEFNIWQYTETGKVRGIKGKVDLNIEFIKK